MYNRRVFRRVKKKVLKGSNLSKLNNISKIYKIDYNKIIKVFYIFIIDKCYAICIFLHFFFFDNCMQKYYYRDEENSNNTTKIEQYLYLS